MAFGSDSVVIIDEGPSCSKSTDVYPRRSSTFWLSSSSSSKPDNESFRKENVSVSNPTHFPRWVGISEEDEEAIRRAQMEDEDFEFAQGLNSQQGISSDNIYQVFTGKTGSGAAGSSSMSLMQKQSQHVDKIGMSLVDPEWETIDPNPDIYSLFNTFNQTYFWGTLGNVEVKWSKQMMMCAGICRYQSRAGYCTIGLSLPLLKFRPRKDLVETLLHEMIHAYLFVASNDRDRDDHGENFHAHMFRINKQTGTNITVYHSFHDEVEHYRRHIWRCDGPCRDQKPYYGFVKRSRNLAPSPNDLWWAQHAAKCKGQFIKIGQPEGYKPRKRKNQGGEPQARPSRQGTLTDFGGFYPVTATGSKTKEVASSSSETSSTGKGHDQKKKKQPTLLFELGGNPKPDSQPSSSGSFSSSNIAKQISLKPKVTPKKAEPLLSVTGKGQLSLDSFFPRSSNAAPLKSVAKTKTPEVILLDD